jgi:hypothetical protein
MPRLYNLIEDQVSIITRMIMENDYGDVEYGGFIRSPKWVKPIINLVSVLIYLGILFVGGLFLWNRGLSAVIPAISPIGESRPKQLRNRFTQLLLTLIALMMFV